MSLLLFGLISFLGCQSRQSLVESGNQKQILHRGSGTEPDSLDPHRQVSVESSHITRALFEGLTTEDPKTLRPIPGAAESWTVSKDRKTWTFYLRDQAKWSNGEDLLASDFVYSWKRSLSPEMATSYAYMLYPIRGAEAFNQGKIQDFSQVGVRAKGDRVLVVELDSPTPYFLSILAHSSAYPVHQATVEKHGREWVRPQNMVSNGAFQLSDWKINQVIQVAKNPHYWDAEIVRLQGIWFHQFDSTQTEERAFRSSQLHITASLPINKIATYREGKQKSLLRNHPISATYYYRFNTKKKPFQDRRVREAFAISVDREEVVQGVTKGGQFPAYAFTPPGTAGYTSRAQLQSDPDRARKLLAQAGYPGGKGFPKIEILYNTLEGHQVIAEALQQMWKKELQVQVQITNQDWKVFLDTVRLGNYQIARAAWNGDYNDPSTFLELFVSGGGNNQTGWSNAAYDRWIREAARLSGADRFRAFQEAEKILLSELPIVPIYYYTRSYLVQPSVRGYFTNVQDRHNWKYVYLDSSEGVNSK